MKKSKLLEELSHLTLALSNVAKKERQNSLASEEDLTRIKRFCVTFLDNGKRDSVVFDNLAEAENFLRNSKRLELTRTPLRTQCIYVYEVDCAINKLVEEVFAPQPSWTKYPKAKLEIHYCQKDAKGQLTYLSQFLEDVLDKEIDGKIVKCYRYYGETNTVTEVEAKNFKFDN